METETVPVEEIKPLPVPESRWERLLYALVVTILPIICFSVSDVLKPEWQSGELSAYLDLLLLPQIAWFFFPFLVYAVVCLLLLLIAPRYFAPRFVVRLGIYTGVLLALQFVILIGTGALYSLAFAGILILSTWIYGKIKPGWRPGYVIVWVVLTIIIVVVFFRPSFQLEALKSFLISVPFGALIVILLAAPVLCLAVMAVTSVKLFKIYELRTPFSLWPGTGLIAWLVAYSAAWRFSILQAIQVYHSLPTSPPDCYIATASARGHKRVVRSWPVATSGGTLLVTQQLQVFKCVELALMTLAPRFHRILRTIYNVAGYRLAKYLTNPFLADLAYLTLKPVEWIARFILKVIIPDIDEYARRLYCVSE